MVAIGDKIRSKVSDIQEAIPQMIPNEKKSPPRDKMLVVEEEQTTDWSSIYIVAFVAFIGSVHTHCIAPGIWPYMIEVIPNVSEDFFGFIGSVSSTGIVLSAVIAGYCSNKLRDTKWPMAFGKMMAIVSCVLYMGIELVDADSRRVMFAVFELLLGISVGAAQIYRTHVAMASTEEDRPKAVGICSLAPSIGLFIGPLGQIIFTTLGYPGLPFLFGTHINLYTAPIVLTIIISIIGFTLLVFYFDGRMKVYKPKTPPSIESDDCSSASIQSVQSFDGVAVFVCMFTKMLVNLCTLNFMTIGPPYTMTVFRWTSTKSVLYMSICMGLVGLNIIFWNMAYIFLDLRKRLSERRAILIAIVCLLAAYLITYPWPFLDGTIAYRGANGSDDGTGCNPDFKWCAETPAVNMIVFLGSLITVLGFALPLCSINLDILFSKVLGNMRQGTMQGLFIVSGEALSIVGPIILSRVYTLTGPTYIWQFEIVFISLSIILWLIFYKRMIGQSRRNATVD